MGYDDVDAEDKNLSIIIEGLRELRLTPHEIRTVICTYTGKGPVEGLFNILAILRGKEYHSFSLIDNENAENTEDFDNDEKNKLSEYDFGIFLKNQFYEAYSDAQNSYTALLSTMDILKHEYDGKLKIDCKFNTNTKFEIKAATFFAFEYGMIWGIKLKKREVIRESFLKALNCSSTEIEELSSRTIEYFQAFNNGSDNPYKFVAVGQVFAKYTNNNKNLFMIMFATTIIWKLTKHVKNFINKKLIN